MLTGTLSTRSAIRVFAAGLIGSRRIALWSAFAVLASATIMAQLSQPNFKAHTMLLVLPGPEQAYRPNAGEVSFVNAPLDREQILRTEITILSQPDLQRAVVQKVGIERLYPELFQPLGRLGQLAADATRWFRTKLEGNQSVIARNDPEGTESIRERARRLLERDLDPRVIKLSNSIDLSFSHPDANVAAQVLDTLTNLYFERRRELVSNAQSFLVSQQANELHVRLSDADRALADFKQQNNISGYTTRRDVLTQAQGALEADLYAASSQLAQNQARLASARRQIAGTEPSIVQERSADIDVRLAPQRASIELLRVKLTDLLTRYRADSPFVTELSSQLATREAEFARLRRDDSTSGTKIARNPLYASLEIDVTKAEGDVKAAEARSGADQMLLKEVADKLQLLTRLEQHLGELERTRNILDEQYRTAAKLAEDRRTTEAVESNKVSSVRVIQKPVPPLLAEGNRRIILAAGVVLAGLAGGLAALMGHWLRTTYLVAAAVEQDLRIPVLVVVPEGAAEHATLLRLAIG